MSELLTTLETCCNRKDQQRQKVLIIDDDQQLMEFYSLLLSEHDIDCFTLAEPEHVFKALETYQPDLVLLDLYMPQYNGKVIAKLIRDDLTWRRIPIIFLSAEPDQNIHIECLDAGGDDFIIKTQSPEWLIKVICSRLKYAQLSKQQHGFLSDTLKDSIAFRYALDKHNIVSITDRNGVIIYANQNFCDISGYSMDELYGKNHNIINSGYHPYSFFNMMWKTISRGEIWQGEIRNRAKNGDYYWVLTTIVPKLNEFGDISEYVSIRTDITSIKSTESKLKRSQIYANLGTWEWNILTNKIDCSERVAALFGLPSNDSLEDFEGFLRLMHKDDIEPFKQAAQDCLKHAKNFSLQYRIVWPDSTVHWMSQRGDAVRDINGNPQHILCIVQDITQQKLFEAELRHAQLDAEKANIAKSRFLSSMSHEMRTPLNAILGFAQLLHMENFPDEIEQCVSEIRYAGKHLLDLINDILDLSRIESGNFELRIQSVDIHDLIEDCLPILDPYLQHKSLSIHVNENSFADVSLLGDVTRIKQVLLNLLSNACKYNTENGHVNVHCEVGSGKARVFISDTGKGLSESDQRDLFTPFNRLGAENSDIEGTGIGLVISRQLLKSMQGDIGAISHLGEGSTFWFELPLAMTDTNSTTCIDTKAVITPLMRRHDILYVEDNPANLRLVNNIFKRIPEVQLYATRNPKDGLALADKNNLSLILLDINLPDMDGYAVLAKLRQNRKTRNIPVIAVSANAMREDIDKATEAGFNGYITKPIDIEGFVSEISKYLANMKEDSARNA